eukprot:229139_1
MGLLFSRLYSLILGNQEVRILILGLDNAGKTTVLYKLQAPESIKIHEPTIGFNVETLTHKNIKFQVWDLGGQTNIRPYWRCYYPNTNVIIFVVDSADVDRMDLAKKELHSMLQEEELKNTHILVFANKQDMPGSLSDTEVSQRLALPTIKNRQWHVQKTCAIKGDGLDAGLEWMVNVVNAK